MPYGEEMELKSNSETLEHIIHPLRKQVAEITEERDRLKDTLTKTKKLIHLGSVKSEGLSKEDCKLLDSLLEMGETLNKALTRVHSKQEPKPDYYYKSNSGHTVYGEKDPEVTCWHCKKTFLCDPMDATCRMCDAPYDKTRCEEFNFQPSEPEQKKELKEIRDGQKKRSEAWMKKNGF